MAEPLTPEDEAVLAKLADRIVEMRLETPAILTLETVAPLAFVGGQAMLFFEPIVAMLFRFPEYRRFAALAERREALARLTVLIEQRIDARDRTRAADAPAAPSGTKAP